MAAARAETAEKLGYVGLGMMGLPMARRLLAPVTMSQSGTGPR